MSQTPENSSRHGWQGSILHVDLTTRSATPLSPDAALYHRCIGGRGLAGHFLAPHAGKAWDAPDMPLLLFPGPMAGTDAPLSGQTSIISRSPLTGGIGDAPAGGRLGQEIKRAGWDGIIITGRAAAPTGLRINNGDVSFEDASPYSDATVSDIFDALGAEGALVCTGPAAEKGVRFAGLAVDGNVAGRTGLGLSAAAKKLKFMTVYGSGHVSVADPQALQSAREEILRLTAASSVLMGQNGFAHYGTGALFDLMHTRRMMPTDNFRRTRFDAAPSLSAVAWCKRYKATGQGCAGCHIRCGMVSSSGDPLPSFEAMSHFTALIGNSDMDLAMQANLLCQDLGMDPVSTAATIACHSEITGAPIASERLLPLLREIACNTGVGAALGKGSKIYAASEDRGALSMSVKGLELPPFDPRGAYGMALAYAVSTIGGSHVRACPISHEILRKPVATDRFSYSGKARIIKIAEDGIAAADALGICGFAFFAASLEEYAKAYAAVTGVEATPHDLLRAGERIDYQERLLNACWGFDARHDDLPPRFFTEPGTGGDGLDIPPLSREAFLDARRRYYRIRGLDQEGRPLRAKAGSLDLQWPDCPGNAAADWEK